MSQAQAIKPTPTDEPLTAEVRFTRRTHDLEVVFHDGVTEVFRSVESSWIDNGVLRIRCGTNLYALPLTGIRLWHRSLA